jgi:hypothetical protein
VQREAKDIIIIIIITREGKLEQFCSKGSQAVPARPSVEVRCRQGGSVIASGQLEGAEGKQVEFCVCLVGSGMATFWYLLEGCTISMHCKVGLL